MSKRLTQPYIVWVIGIMVLFVALVVVYHVRRTYAAVATLTITGGLQNTGDLTFPANPNGTATVDNPQPSYTMMLTASSYNTGLDQPVSNTFKLRTTGYSGAGVDYRFGIINQAGTELLSIKANGNVGIGNASPGSKLTVAGTIESVSGGLIFPDATTQATALSAALIPTGAVTFFNLSTATGCPSGWAEVTTARGRVIVARPLGGTNGTTNGSALGNLGTLTTTSYGTGHTHTGNPASTNSTGESVNHTHTADPVGAASDTGTSVHTHTWTTTTTVGQQLNFRQGGTNVAWSGDVTSSQGGGAHTWDIAPFSSATESVTHTHTVDPAAVATSNPVGGAASVDITTPYIQYLVCQK